jgi:signal transduction histidine kinase
VLGLTASWALSLVTTTVMLAMAGGVGGYVVDLLRRTEARATKAERRVAQASAREEVARQLHDGVLQTLAVVERRTDDPQLARLAREQEQDLRSYLFDVPDPPVVGAGALGDALRHVARRCETTHGLRTDVLVPDDLPDVSSHVIAVLKGAVGEAMTNAAKHAEAARVVVYVEPLDGGIFCSVRDDGTGFDVAATPEGVGLSRSNRGRIEQAGGTVQLDSAPGRGTEVRLTVPLDGTERSDA